MGQRGSCTGRGQRQHARAAVVAGADVTHSGRVVDERQNVLAALEVAGDGHGGTGQGSVVCVSDGDVAVDHHRRTGNVATFDKGRAAAAGDGHRGGVVTRDQNAIADRVGNHDGGARPRIPVFKHPEVVGVGVGGRRSVLVHEQGQCCTIGGAHGHRKAGVGRDVHIRRIGQRVVESAFTQQTHPVGRNVIICACEGQKVDASHR